MEFILSKKSLQRDQVLFLSACVHKKYPLFKGKIKAPLKIVPSKLFSKPDLNKISRVYIAFMVRGGGAKYIHYVLGLNGIIMLYYLQLDIDIYIYISKYNLYQARIY